MGKKRVVGSHCKVFKLNQGGNNNGQKRECKGGLRGQEVGQENGNGQTRLYQKASQDTKRWKGKDFWALNLKSGEGGASTNKKSSKGEASKGNI